jgi:uncharacterized protein YcfL
VKKYAANISPGFFFIGIIVFILAVTTVSASDVSSFAHKVESLGKMVHIRVNDIKEIERNGLLSLQVEVVNDSRHEQKIFYRFRWVDNSGFTVWGEEPWKPALVHGKQKFIINTVAPNKAAQDYRLEIQSPENITGPR